MKNPKKIPINIEVGIEITCLMSGKNVVIPKYVRNPITSIKIILIKNRVIIDLLIST